MAESLTGTTLVLGTWITRQLVFDGLVNGLVIGLVALGIVLIYRSTRVINFAVGNMGIPGASLFALMVLNYGFPFWIALVLSLIVGVLFASIMWGLVIRRLFTAPRVVVLVATIGIAQLAQAIVVAYPDFDVEPGVRYPVAVGSTWSDVAGLRQVTGPQLTILVVAPLLAIGLALFLNRTLFGRSVHAAADNADLARLSGINPKVVSFFVWATAGFLSTIGIILISGDSGSVTGLLNLGPNTLVRALAAATIAGFRSFPRALAAGVVVGVVEALIRFNFITETGLTDFVLLLAVLVAVFYASRAEADEVGATFSFTPRVRAVPEKLARTRIPATVSALGIGVVGLAMIVLPFVDDRPSQILLYSTVFAFAVCAASVTVVTGWSGQLSLSQMAFAGLGALLAARLNGGISLDVGWHDNRLLVVDLPGMPFFLAIFVAAVLTAGIAAVVGLGALRVKGLLLAVSTFAFAVAAQQYLYRRPIFSGGESQSVTFRRGELWVPYPSGSGIEVWRIDFSNQRTYYFFALAVLTLVLGITARLRRTGVGRRILGVRDNPNSAAAFTVGPSGVKLSAFTYAGGVAGLGGAVLSGATQSIPFTERFFVIEDSLRIVAMAVIGGLGSVFGAFFGAWYVIGLPAIWRDNELVPLFTSSIGLLLLLLYFPAGLDGVRLKARDALYGWLDGRLEDEPRPERPTVAPAVHSERPEGGRNEDGSVLRTDDVVVSFGGVQAVAGVSVTARPGEILGLIGTNGAGKSTLMNAIGGYVPSRGRIELFGSDVSHLASADRAALGLGRTFQAATLFPELTVRESVQLSLEARRATPFVATALHMPHSFALERRSRAEADELIDFLGLGRYASAYIADLSTGTRRIVELACILGLGARLLCLDEPTAGVAQRETEAFGPLIVDIRAELDATMIVIEHDMPLIMSISDRVYCLEAGEVIAEGSPAEVRSDPLVVASYLGTDERAIARSDAGAAPS